MRKRLRKKAAKKSSNLFKIKKKLAIAELVISTYKAYAGLIKKGYPPIVNKAMAWGIYSSFLASKSAIIQARHDAPVAIGGSQTITSHIGDI